MLWRYATKSVVMAALQVLWKDIQFSGVSLQLIVKQENREVMTERGKRRGEGKGWGGLLKPRLVKGVLEGGRSECPCILFQ